MIRIAISQAAFQALASTPPANVGLERELSPAGEKPASFSA